MKEKFIELLKNHKVTSIEEPNWKYFEIEHKVNPCNDLKSVREYVTKNGLYAYVDANDVLLYIGKEKPIKDRIYSHCIETYKQVSGDRTGKWHRFFNKHNGNLKVFWIELEDESVRRFVEHFLTEELQPEFIEFEK